MTNKQAAEKISGLEARISELESDLASATTENETLQSEAATAAETIAALTTACKEAASKLSAAQATIAEQEQTITAANEKLASFEEEVNSRVLHGIANLGFKGEIPNSSLEAGDEKNLREQINAIPDAKKRQEARLKNWEKL